MFIHLLVWWPYRLYFVTPRGSERYFENMFNWKFNISEQSSYPFGTPTFFTWHIWNFRQTTSAYWTMKKNMAGYWSILLFQIQMSRKKNDSLFLFIKVEQNSAVKSKRIQNKYLLEKREGRYNNIIYTSQLLHHIAKTNEKW